LPNGLVRVGAEWATALSGRLERRADRHPALVEPHRSQAAHRRRHARASRRFFGGRIYDRGTDGSECEWATVLAYEPPDRVVFSWNVSPHWQVETNPDKPQRGRGAVHCAGRATHPRAARAPSSRPPRRRLGRRRDGVAAPDGWGLYLGRYADLV
jgi:uncharacterized protein YndB with AHSA1/START domain